MIYHPIAAFFLLIGIAFIVLVVLIKVFGDKADREYNDQQLTNPKGNENISSNNRLHIVRDSRLAEHGDNVGE